MSLCIIKCGLPRLLPYRKTRAPLTCAQICTSICSTNVVVVFTEKWCFCCCSRLSFSGSFDNFGITYFEYVMSMLGLYLDMNMVDNLVLSKQSCCCCFHGEVVFVVVVVHVHLVSFFHLVMWKFFHYSFWIYYVNVRFVFRYE